MTVSVIQINVAYPLINYIYYRCPPASLEIHLNTPLYSFIQHKVMITILEKLSLCIILVNMQTIFRPQLFKTE